MPWVGLQCIIVMFSDPSHLFCFHNLCSTTYFGYLSKDSNATAHKLSIISYWYAQSMEISGDSEKSIRFYMFYELIHG